MICFKCEIGTTSRKAIFGIATTTLLCACVSNPTIDDLVAKGGMIVDPREQIGDTGTTYIGENDSWYNYLGPDGRKVVKVKETGVVKELTWRENENGEFCQQMFATEKEECANAVIIKDKDGIYNSYSKEGNKPGFPFTVVSGNPQGL